MKVGILTTHPIQYQVPWFRKLSQIPEVDLTVFFGMIPDAKQQGDGFGVAFTWDIPLMEGYEYRVLKNVSSSPSVTTFFGCDTPEISAIVRNDQFDAFIVNGWVAKSCVQLLVACNRYNTPCIVRGESNNLRPRALWKKAIHRLLLSRYAAFLNIGKANRNFYLQNGVPENIIFFAPYCVENDRFETQSRELWQDRKRFRSDWNIPEEAATFLFCAKFIEKKRPMDLLEALEIVCRKAPGLSDKIHVLMVGEGELKKLCERFAEERNLPVSFAGFLNQSELPRAYAAADCLVLPSDFGETWGLVVNEAMSSGLPAIVSDQVGCYPDLIDAGRTGEAYPCGDVNALADLMIKCVQDPDRLRQMGINANKKIKAYCYDAVVSGTVAALEFVLGAKRQDSSS